MLSVWRVAVLHSGVKPRVREAASSSLWLSPHFCPHCPISILLLPTGFQSVVCVALLRSCLNDESSLVSSLSMV